MGKKISVLLFLRRQRRGTGNWILVRTADALFRFPRTASPPVYAGLISVCLSGAMVWQRAPPSLPEESHSRNDCDPLYFFSERLSCGHTEAMFIHVRMTFFDMFIHIRMDMEKDRHILPKRAKWRSNENNEKERNDNKEGGSWRESWHKCLMKDRYEGGNFCLSGDTILNTSTITTRHLHLIYLRYLFNIEIYLTPKSSFSLHSLLQRLL